MAEPPSHFFTDCVALQEVSKDYAVVVVEDQQQGKIVGTAAVVVERKFLRGCGKVAHVEDVVVDESCRGKSFGKR